MMDIIKQLREATGASIMDCKRVVDEAKGDYEKALALLKARGKAIAEKKQGRTASEGIIDAYIHQNGKVGVLLELRSETDFVARNDEFKHLAHEISLQIAAMKPRYVRESEIPADVLAEEREIFKKEVEGIDKPAQVKESIIEGKMKKRAAELCLLSQPYVKDQDKTIQMLIEEVTAKLGEKIEIGRFVRFEIGA